MASSRASSSRWSSGWFLSPGPDHRGGPRGIGRSVTKAVVNSIVLIVSVDYLLTRICSNDEYRSAEPGWCQRRGARPAQELNQQEVLKAWISTYRRGNLAGIGRFEADQVFEQDGLPLPWAHDNEISPFCTSKSGL